MPETPKRSGRPPHEPRPPHPHDGPLDIEADVKGGDIDDPPDDPGPALGGEPRPSPPKP